MNRAMLLLAAVGAVLVIALFYVAIFQPAREELAEVEAQIELEINEQVRLEEEIARLRSVRAEAPTVEAELATGEAIVPRDPALPALIRQLQLAADESGLTLATVSTQRPAPVPESTEPGLSAISTSMLLEGGYFQVVDFLRRLEDPGITPRGILWENATVSRADGEYPDLSVALTGTVFAVIDVPLPPEPEIDEADAGPSDDDQDAEEDPTDDAEDGS